MLAVEKPEDLLRLTYTLLQANTTKRPGPSLIGLLKKAGIELVEPPTQQEINALIKTKTNKPSLTNEIKTIAKNIAVETVLENAATVAAAAAGGGLINNIRSAISSDRQLQLSIAIAVTGIALDIARYATRENDEQTLLFLSDSSWIGMVGTWIGADLYRSVQAIQTERARAEREAELRRNIFANDPLPRRRRIVVDFTTIQQAALQEEPQMVNITTLPSLGDLPLVLKEDVIDPITQQPFAVGDVVAVVNGKTQQPVLRDSLQSWIASCFAQSRPLTHPTTRETITNENVTIYTVKAAPSGGKRSSLSGKRSGLSAKRKTRKLKKLSKKYQNVRSLRKRRQIHKKR